MRRNTLFFPATARFSLVQNILREIPKQTHPDHFQIYRLAALIVDTNIREHFVHNGMFSSMVLSAMLTKLAIANRVRVEAVRVPEIFPHSRVMAHASVEILPDPNCRQKEGVAPLCVHLSSYLAPYWALAEHHGINPCGTSEDRHRLAALFTEHNLDPSELHVFAERAEVPLEILGHYFQASGGTLPMVKRTVCEADTEITYGFPMEMFRKAVADPGYYLSGMPPAQRVMWDSVVERGLKTDDIDF